MTLRARLQLEDSFAREQACTICGESALSVVHLKGFPDYVTCARCGAAFVMEEGGPRAMYGSIPPEYPETRDFALKQWTSLEAIAALAEAERPRRQSANHSGMHQAAAAQPPDDQPSPEDPLEAEVAVEAQPAVQAQPATEPAVEPEPPLEPFVWPAPKSRPGLQPELTSEPAAEPAPPSESFDWPAPASEPVPEPELAAEPAAEPAPPSESFDWPAPASEPVPEPAAEASPEPEAPEASREPAAEASPEPEAPEASWEPEPSRRFRVRFMGAQPHIPAGTCAHCLRTSARRSLVVVGVASGPSGQPRRASYTLPLCSSCYGRARAKSEEERNSRLMAHLISALMAAVVMVGALALQLVPFESPLLAVALLGVLGIGGYGLPVLLLLGRAGRFRPPADALLVRSTLLVSAQPGAGETLFDWRNPGFASQFLEANAGKSGETIFEVADPLLRPDSSHDEPHA